MVQRLKERLLQTFTGGPRPQERPHSTTLLIPALIFLPGLLLSAVFAATIARQNARDFTAFQREQATALSRNLENRTNIYQEVLMAGAALFEIHGDVSRQEWSQFFTDMKVQERLPSLMGLGYVEAFSAEQLAAHTERVQGEGFADYNVRPATPRPDYTAITYLEPFTAANQRAFGYDMATEAVRRTAMYAARDQAAAVMSAPVALVQTAGTSQQSAPGALMYYPVYTSSTVPSTVEARRAQFRGYIYAVFQPADMVERQLTSKRGGNEKPGVVLADVSAAGTKEFFRSTQAERDATYRQSFPVVGRTWQLTLHDKNAVINRYITPSSTLLLGALSSLAVSATLYTFLKRRLEQAQQTFDQAIQRTKDELLALASHQLRTPASGVKQYVGLLTQGFVGTLSPEQMEIAKKAYQANERQLEIIDQLLYVSKADAGQLHIQPTVTDLTQLVTTVVEDVAETAAAKHIDVVFRRTQPCKVEADPRYVTMIVENLLSNAIKYSHERSRVTLQLRPTRTMVELTVQDRGVGIAQEDLDRLFNKFSRIENPLSRAEGGSGLGLFLSQQLARAHGGQISVSTELAKGSTFVLGLPKRCSQHTAQL